LTTGIDHTMFNVCWRHYNSMFSQFPAFPADVEGALPFEDIINLVSPGMHMRFLLLAGLKTIQITEHASGLEQVHFLHLLLVKIFQAEDLLGIHPCPPHAVTHAHESL